jgi:hypothetical protein
MLEAQQVTVGKLKTPTRISIVRKAHQFLLRTSPDSRIATSTSRDNARMMTGVGAWFRYSAGLDPDWRWDMCSRGLMIRGVGHAVSE